MFQYGWVDRNNQQLSYYNTEFMCVRKQSRVLDSLMEMYVLVNGHTLWRNNPQLLEGLSKDSTSQSEFRFAIIRIWYAMYKKTNGRDEVLHYPFNKQRHHRRKLATTLASPRKGHHDSARITADETSSKRCRLKCRMCSKKTSFKCAKCSNPGDPLALCESKNGRQCWNEYHVRREFDIPSSQSQDDA